MMKKIIALALALSMALSMVAFAGYTDADLINTDLTADVELVKALGLMTGNPDGSFNPLGTLTRGEAAVIIYRLSSLKKDIDASWGDAALSAFSDMAGHWSAPYVNYCAALGLITGNPDGTYRPNNPVTAVEMAKMLLNAAGYDTDKQGYGKNWPGAVLADATNAGLFTDFEAAYTAAASREWVAKLVANLINKVQTVSYSQLTGALVKNTVGNTTTPSIFGTEKYAVDTFTGIAVKNDLVGLDGATKAADGYSVVGEATIKYDIPTEMLGHSVKVYYNTLTNAVYTVVDTSTSVTTTLDALELKTASSKTNLYINGVKHATEASHLTKLYVNLDERAGTLSTWKTATKIADTREVTLVDTNADGKYDSLFMNEVVYGVVTDIDTTAQTGELTTAAGTVTIVKGTPSAGQIKWDTITFADTVAEDDVVCVETTINAEGKAVHTVSKVNALRTKISSVLPEDVTFVVGADKYTGSASALSGFSMSSFVNGLDANDLKKTYDVYTDGKYVIYAAEEQGATATSGIPSNIAYLIASQKGTAANAFEAAVADKVQVMFADGTIAIYEYKAPTSSSVTKVAFLNGENVNVTNGAVYEYVLNDDGTIYFKQLATAYTDPADVDTTWVEATAISALAVNKELSKTKITIGTAGSAVTTYANADSFLFVALTKNSKTTYSVVKVSELAENGDWSAYTFGATSAYYFDEATGLNYLAYGVVSHSNSDKLPATPDTASGSDWFLVLKTAKPVVTADGTTYSVEGINAKGEAATLVLTSKEIGTVTGTGSNAVHSVTAADSDSSNDVVANKVYVVKSNSEDTWLAPMTAAWTEGNFTASTGTAVMIGGELVDVAADAVIVYLKESSTTADSYSKVAGPDKLPFGSESAEQVYYTTNSSDKVNKVIVVVNADNEIVDNAEITFCVQQ